mmetsp:Transcript_18624/g.29224  ORF Transcript_18624/g.29224 Transcript_18624/m.29224 type:complete len:260 (-) Transcript_18624:17-796(-)
MRSLRLTNVVKPRKHIRVLDSLLLIVILLLPHIHALHLHPPANHIERMRARLRRRSSRRAHQEQRRRPHGPHVRLPPLPQRFVHHELHADVREHGDQRGSQAAVQPSDPRGPVHEPQGGADGLALFGVEREHGLHHLEGVDDGGGDHSGHSSGAESGAGVETAGTAGRTRGDQAESRQDHSALDELVHQKLRAATGRHLEAIRAVALEHSPKSLPLPRLFEFVRHGGDGVPAAHHDSGDHFDGSAERSRDDAGDGSRVN